MPKSIETLRHGHKKEEDLSEEGRSQAKEKAKKLIAEIELAPGGAVFYIMPSIVERAKDTRDVIESTLRDLVNEGGSEDIVFISVNDIDRIKKAQGDFSKKYIITDLQPSTPLGFKENKTASLSTYVETREMFEGDEDYTGLVWAARTDEVESLRERIKQKFPGVKVENIEPKKFNEPPEEAALRYLKLIKRMIEITNKYFSDHSWKSLFIGHAPALDFATMGVLGKDISMKTFDEMGERFRDFLEPANFELRDGRIKVKYRDQETEIEKDLDEIINHLEQKSAERKKEWEK